MTHISLKYTGNVLIAGNPDSGDVIVRAIFTNEDESEFYAGIPFGDGIIPVPLGEFTDELVAVAICDGFDDDLIERCMEAAERAALRALANA